MLLNIIVIKINIKILSNLRVVVSLIISTVKKLFNIKKINSPEVLKKEIKSEIWFLKKEKSLNF